MTAVVVVNESCVLEASGNRDADGAIVQVGWFRGCMETRETSTYGLFTAAIKNGYVFAGCVGRLCNPDTVERGV